MKRMITFLPLLGCLVGGWLIVATGLEHRENKQDISAEETAPPVAAIPDAETYSTQDRELLQQVFSAPEVLDAKEAEVGLPQKTQEATKSPERPALMSAQFQGTETGLVEAEVEPVQVASPLIESFASLRTDAVRNPESEQNQATVRSIMEKRQRRMVQLEQKQGTTHSH